MDTTPVNPINISLFEPTFESPLSGQLSCHTPPDSKITEININILNKEQENVFSKKLDLKKLENGILPFDLNEIMLNGTYYFSIDAKNEQGKVIAKTNQEFTLQTPQKHQAKTANELFNLDAKEASAESQRQAALKRLEEQRQIATQEKIKEIKTEKDNLASNMINFIGIPLLSLFLVGLFAYFVRKKRRQNKNLSILFLAFLFLPQLSFAQTFDQTQTAEIWQWTWEHPITGWDFSSEDNGSQFNEMYISGEVIKGDSGLFGVDGKNIKNMRIRFEKDSNIFEYELRLQDLSTPIPSEFNITIDLSQLDGLPDNEYTFNILFETADKQWFMSNWGQTVKIDSTPPNLNFSYTPDGTGGNTNQEISVIVNCDDPNSGCNKDSYDGHQVYGNFCQDATICDSSKPNGYKVCDLTMNCTDTSQLKNKAEITWFDNLAPDLNDFALGIGTFFNTPNQLKAVDSFQAKISYEDKRRQHHNQQSSRSVAISCARIFHSRYRK